MLRQRNDLPLAGDPADRLMPWIIGILTFLSALVLAAALVLDNGIEHWRLSNSVQMTVEVPPGAGEEGLARVVEALRTTPGIVEAGPLTRDAMLELLEPWLGGGLDTSSLPLPVLVDVRLSQPGAIDAEALETILSKAQPGARVDDDRRYLEPVRLTARALQLVAGLMLAMIIGAAMATVVFMTRTGLAIHHDAIEVLHLIGARDGYVARQFESRVLRLSLTGAVIGTFTAAAALHLVGRVAGDLEAPLLPDLALGVTGWIALVALPLAIAAVAVATARVTVIGALKRMP